MYPAMISGKQMLENAAARVKHMIVLTDGQTQPADHEALVNDMAQADGVNPAGVSPR